jgi:hypothetical protein
MSFSRKSPASRRDVTRKHQRRTRRSKSRVLQCEPLEARNLLSAIRALPGFAANVLNRNDDGSTGQVPIGFTANFFGVSRSTAYVNNNGNITLDSALSTFTPFDLTSTQCQIIAPYFADVDTQNASSGVVTYGNDTVDGHLAFAANYINVGYFPSSADKLCSFQVVLVDRTDTGVGNFDIEFNYDKIQWEAGSASGGSGGLGGSSARAGYSNGTRVTGTFFELPGSAVNGAFLDSNMTTGLIHNSIGSSEPGRYVFQARQGHISLQTVFDSLSSPSIPPGTPNVALSGHIAAGAQIPPGQISITVADVTQMADIDPATGNFVSVFATASLTPFGSPYPITYSYAGGTRGTTDFSAASDVAHRLTVLSPLYAVAHAPNGDQTEPVSSLTVEFNEPINASTFTHEDVAIEGPAGPIAMIGEPSYVSGNTYRINFAQQSLVGAYHVFVGPQIQSSSGLVMDQDRDGIGGEPDDDRYDASFAIIDTTGPRIIGSLPDRPQQNVLDHLDVTFSEPIKTDTFDIGDVAISGPEGVIAADSVEQIDARNYRIRFPAQTAEGVYRVVIGPNIQDLALNYMDQNQNGLKDEPDDVYIASLAIDRVPPVVAGNSLSGVQNAAVRAFEVTFDEDIDLATFTPAIVTVTGPAGIRQASGVEALAGNRFRVTVPPTLADGTYHVVIAPTVADLAGNALATAYLFDFVQQLPDLMVTAGVYPLECLAGQQIDIQWTVRNAGLGRAAGTWSDVVSLSANAQGTGATELARLNFSQPLAPGESYTRAATVTIPADADGSRWIVIAADGTRALDETAESNNVSVRTPSLYVTTRPHPDLVVSSVNAPSTLSAGESAPITWTVRNLGTGATTASYWYDSLYLSADTTLDASDLQLVRKANPDFLGTGESYIQSADVTIPDTVARGAYYLIAVADVTNTVQEFDRENNNATASASASDVITPPPAVLTVTNIQVGGPLAPGMIPTFTWTITNTGGTTITTGWSNGTGWDDGLALSRDPYYQVDQDYWLGSHTYWHGLPLHPGQSYTSTGHAEHAVPVWEPGTYYLIVLPDTHEGAGSGFGQSTIARSYGVAPVQLSYTAPDLVPASVTAPPTGIVGQSLRVDWSVANQSAGQAATSWSDAVYLSADNVLDSQDAPLCTLAHTGPLNPGASYAAGTSFTVPGGIEPGTYYVILKSNASGSLPEADRTNNVIVSANPVAITRIESDLLVVSANGPATGMAGQSVQVDWTVINGGPDTTATGNWADGIYLSPSGTFDRATARLLGEFPHASTLDPQATYIRSESIAIPSRTEGNFHLFLVLDSRNELFEFGGEDNNVREIGASFEIIDHQPDLKVTDFSAPATAIAGRTVSLNWRVENDGTAPAAATWRDALYLSKDDVLGPEDGAPLATFTQTASLAVGDGYGPPDAPISILLPDGIEGTYFLIFAADSEANVYEKGFESNNVVKQAIQITDLVPDLVVQTATISAQGRAGQYVTVDYLAINQGQEEANGQWKDAFYLSADDQFDPATDRLIGEFDQSGPLGVGGTYGPRVTPAYVRLPDRIEGTFRVFVVADYKNSIAEKTGEANNVYLIPQPITVALTPADLVVTSVQTPSAATAGSIVRLSWTVVNQGPEPTDVQTWRDGIYLSTDTEFEPNADVELGVMPHSGGLGAGDSYSVTQDFSLRQDLQGPYYVYVITDLRHQVFEHQAENNNTAAADHLLSVAGVHSDLRVAALDAPATAVAGDSVEVHWTVVNAGPDATPSSSWSDAVYLSNDSELDASDTLLGIFPHNGGLLNGDTYAQTRQILFPKDAAGALHLIVKTDGGDTNGVYEYQAEDNNTAVADVVLSLAPPVDLQVTQIVALTTAWSGQTMNVQWTVTNTGGSLATADKGGWYDSIYLSRDPYLDRNADIALGSVLYQGELTPNGGSYTASLDAHLPPGVSGPYYVLVATDSNDRVFERGREDNNVGEAPSAVTINLTPPCDLQVTGVTLPPSATYGDSVVWQYEVTNRDTLDAFGSWYDTLYLSTDRQWDLNDVRIARVRHDGDVPHAQSYAGSVTAEVPAVVPGDYYVIVRTDILNDVRELDETNNTGVSSTTYRVEGRGLALGGSVSATLDAGKAIYYQVDVAAGQDFTVALQGAAAEQAEVCVAYGRMPGRAEYQFKSALESDGRQVANVSAMQGGTYYVLVYADWSLGSRAFDLSAEGVSFSIHSVAPDRVGNAGNATLVIGGARFDASTSFELVDAVGKVTIASKVQLDQSTTAYVTFDCYGLTPGGYTLRAVQSNLAPVTYAHPLQIEASSGANVDALFDGPTLVRTGRPGVVQLDYSNTGDQDGLPPLLVLTGENGTSFGLDSTRVGSSQIIHVLGLSQDGPADILRPGVNYGLPIYCRNPLGGPALHARVIEANETAPITNWSEIEAAIRPAIISDQEWQRFWGNIVARIPSTWGDYIKLLAKVAAEVSEPGHPIYDVRALFEALYARDPNFVPFESASGKVVATETGQGVAGVLVGAVAYSGGRYHTVAQTVTDAQGQWTMKDLVPGTYEITTDKYAFDMDQDQKPDLDAPQLTVDRNTDVAGVTIRVITGEKRVGDANSDPAIVTDRQGVTHMVWNNANTVRHTSNSGSGWAQSELIFDGAAMNLHIVAAADLLGSGEDALVITWESGTGNERTVFFSVGRKQGTGWEWSEPQAVVDNSLRNAGADVVVLNDGTPLVVYLTDNADIRDDTDLYFTRVNVNGANLAWPVAQLAQLQSLNRSETSVTAQFGFSHTWKAKIPYLIDGEIGLDIVGTATATNCSLEAGVEGTVSGEGMIPGVGIKPSLEGHASIQASWQASDTQPVWEFEGAKGTVGAEGGVAIVGGVTTILRAFPQTSWLAAILSRAKKIAREAGWTVEDNLNGSLGFDLEDLKWNAGGDAPLPTWRMPDEWGNAQFSLAAGPSFEVEAPDDTLSAKLYGELKGTVQWGTWDWKVEASLGYEYNLWNWLKGAGDVTFATGPLAKTSALATMDGLWVHDPASNLGTGNVYGANSVLGDVASDLFGDGSPSLARDAQGNVFMAWSKAADPYGAHPGNKVLVSQYVNGTWTSPHAIADVGFDTDVTAAYTPDGRPVVVWSHASSDTITEQSTIDDIDAASADADLYYSICDTGAWSAPAPVAATPETDSDVVLKSDADGELRVAWAGLANDETGSIYTSVWNGSAWSNPARVASAQTPGQVELAQVAGDIALYWVENVSTDQAVQQPAIFSSVLDQSGWSPKALFDASALVATVASQSSYGTTMARSGSSTLFGISVPEECRKCTEDKLKQERHGSGDCFVGKEIDWENCIEYSTYKPCRQDSHDPNDILGPVGFSDQRWVVPDANFDYTILFENDARAAASAQLITISQTLNSKLDWSTFALGPIQFANHDVIVPAGLTVYHTQVDLRPEGTNLLVDIQASFDRDTGLAEWVFTGIDPATGELTEHVLDGFLPPNDPETHVGEGSVSYSITPKSDLPSNTEIASAATIVFDWNPPIDTPLWLNTLDSAAPVSRIDPLPESFEVPSFQVSWTSADDAEGSGVSGVDVYVSVDGGAYALWLDSVVANSATFYGDYGHSYAFYTRAWDNVSHLEAPPVAPDAVTRTLPSTISVSGRAWLDLNADGIQDVGETGLSGVSVELHDADGGLVASTSTDQAGYYRFDDVDAMSPHYLVFVADAGYRFSPQGQSDPSRDSDPTPSTGRTDLFVGSSGSNDHWDAGLYQTAEIRGVLFNDIDNDGVRDLGERPLADRTVFLDSNGNGSLEDGELRTQTGTDGSYCFTDLVPGRYVVGQVVPTYWRQNYPGPDGSNDYEPTLPTGFSAAVNVQAQGGDLQTVGYSVPTMTDWNNDGLDDLLVGEKAGSFGQIRLYLNQGSRTAPVFAASSLLQADGVDLAVPAAGCLGAFPRVVDWNGDGAKDLLVGLADGRIEVFLNVGSDDSPQLTSANFVQLGQPGEKTAFDVGDRAAFDVADWNHDGKFDLVVGGLDGKVRVLVNEGTPVAPDFRAAWVLQNAGGDLIVPGGRVSPDVEDLNGDGLIDLVCGNTDGQLYVYMNSGAAVAPKFDQGERLAADGADISLGTARSRPFVHDFSGDGLTDLLVGGADGLVRLFTRSAGSIESPSARQPFAHTLDIASGEVRQNANFGNRLADAAWGATATALNVDPAARMVYGDAITFVASVSSLILVGDRPTGGVQFLVDGVNFGPSISLAGDTVSVVVSGLNAGNHTIVATYVSDDPSIFQNSSASFAAVVSQAPLTITADNASRFYGLANPAFSGNIVGIKNNDAITAVYSTTVTPASPAGTYPILPSAVGAAGVLANYAITLVNGTLAVTPAPTTTSLTTSRNLAVPGQPVTLTAIVTTSTGGQPDGSIVFMDGEATLGTAVLTHGIACVTVDLPLGVHSLAAHYLDSTNYRSSQSNSSVVTVQPVALEPDPIDPAKTALVVGGTRGDDSIIFKQKCGSATIGVWLNDRSLGWFWPTGHIIAYGGAGNDTISVNPSISIDCVLFGGDGDDWLTGGGANDVLVGGKGNDHLCAGGGRDILIGGKGADRLYGRSADDLLIGDSWNGENNDVALLSILGEWSSKRSIDQRISNLRNGRGLAAGYSVNASTILDDNAVDMIWGGAGQDWFLNCSERDELIDFKSGWDRLN